MNLHEYQGKSILSKYGVAVQRGLVAYNADEAVDQAKRLSQERTRCSGKAGSPTGLTSNSEPTAASTTF